MPEEQKTVFISYRRSVAPFIARSIFLDLRAHDYDVFMDVESIDSGTFDTIILNQIEARAHFVLILTPGTLERCAEPGDWLRREIEYAMEKGRNIVPLFVNEFKYDEAAKKLLTGDLAELPRLNGLNVPHDYFDEAMARLRTRFLKQPVSGMVKPTPLADITIVEGKIEEAAAQPTPTKEELTAEQYFNRAYAKAEVDDYEGAIADYTEAIRLNPQYVIAYNNRGWSHYKQGRLSEAILDFEQSIILNPQFIRAYHNRAIAFKQQGNMTKAIVNYREAILSNPQEATLYNGRGVIYLQIGELDKAILDFSKFIDLDAGSPPGYGNRGEAYFASSRFKQALSDFQRALTIDTTYKWANAGLGITQFMLENYGEAKRIWRALVAQDVRYRDADWVGQELNWRPELVEAARKLIATL